MILQFTLDSLCLCIVDVLEILFVTLNVRGHGLLNLKMTHLILDLFLQRTMSFSSPSILF